jgi:sucrose phosphorylase
MNRNYRPSQFHTLEADFSRPLFRINTRFRDSLIDMLSKLYGRRKAERVLPEFERIIQVYYAYKSPHMIEWEKNFRPENRFTQEDAVLITYGDLITDNTEKPLETLEKICIDYFKDAFNTIHILPFFPYSSDRGFAVIDFRQVDPNIGRWDDINRIHDHFRLMFDGVFNHISSKSYWFQEFLNGNPEYTDFFTTYSPRRKVSEKKLRQLLRPRTSEVLTKYSTYRGEKYIWTTFSPDQVDLKFQNPKVLLKMTEIMLYYVRRGADLIRLDAVTYLWDEPGTSGAHLWQTHLIIKMLREILDHVAPHVALITETNVPHSDNISYFGNGSDEAQMVYNFALPPLILHTFFTGDCGRLSDWAEGLVNPSETATYFNFLDSHDGIGIQGARGILSDDEIEQLGSKTVEHDGLLSYKREADGSESIYELNITSYSALNKENSGESSNIQNRRYIAARSIPLVLTGVPGIYLHGLLGSKNDIEAIKNGEEKRNINRDILSKKKLVDQFRDPTTSTSVISNRISLMIAKRAEEEAFHPRSSQQVLFISRRVFSLIRRSSDGRNTVLSLTNISDEEQEIQVPLDLLEGEKSEFRDILTGKTFIGKNGRLTILLEPYRVYWLKY